MKPALDTFFEEYGKKKGVELLNSYFKNMEDDNKKRTYASIIKLSNESKFELRSPRYLRGVKLWGKSEGFFPLKNPNSGIHKNYIEKEI